MLVLLLFSRRKIIFFHQKSFCTCKSNLPLFLSRPFLPDSLKFEQLHVCIMYIYILSMVHKSFFNVYVQIFTCSIPIEFRFKNFQCWKLITEYQTKYMCVCVNTTIYVCWIWWENDLIINSGKCTLWNFFARIKTSWEYISMEKWQNFNDDLDSYGLLYL